MSRSTRTLLWPSDAPRLLTSSESYFYKNWTADLDYNYLLCLRFRTFNLRYFNHRHHERSNTKKTINYLPSTYVENHLKVITNLIATHASDNELPAFAQSPWTTDVPGLELRKSSLRSSQF